MKRLNAIALVFFMIMLAAPAVSADERTAIHADAKLAQPLLPGMTTPQFVVKDTEGNPVSFDPEKMTKPLVLTFYRGGWCPYCNLNLSELRHAEQELKAMDFDIWFISVDQPSMLQKSLDDPEMGYTLLSDAGLEATRAFGIAFQLSDEMFEKYMGAGLDLEGASGETHHVLPVPSTYIIGADGIIRFQYTNPDYRVRLHPDVLLAAAHAYRLNADMRLRERRNQER
jgi:peroxiredoxin